jgi:hypothetical protein
MRGVRYFLAGFQFLLAVFAFFVFVIGFAEIIHWQLVFQRTHPVAPVRTVIVEEMGRAIVTSGLSGIFAWWMGRRALRNLRDARARAREVQRSA